MSNGSSYPAPLILVLGILGIIFVVGSCNFPLLIVPAIVTGVLGWVFGVQALRTIDSGQGNPQDRNLVMVGYILSIITTILSGLALCLFVLGILGLLALFGLGGWQTFRP
ncbi:MAG: hypothetical protein ABDI19_12740 [Armatimonadota bacterium]